MRGVKWGVGCWGKRGITSILAIFIYLLLFFSFFLFKGSVT